jgi:sugar/nucleoside kinase (ribokinase family)
MFEDRNDVVVAGHICLDIIPSFKNKIGSSVENLLRPGSLLNVDKMVLSAGGPVANTGMGMKILGNRVHFVAKIGDDQVGRILKETLASYGKTEGITISTKRLSSYTVVVAPRGLDRIFLHYTGANDCFGYSDIDFDLVKKSRLFHLGYPPLMKMLYVDQGEELSSIFRMAKECGTTTSLDMSLPDCDTPSGKADWKKILCRTLPYVDIFLPSIEEAYYSLYPQQYLSIKSKHPKEELISYIDPSKYSEVAREFIAFGCKMTSLKSGFRGWYFKTSSKKNFKYFGGVRLTDINNWHNRELWCPAFKIRKIASATGSGDASIAGFLTALLRGCHIEECLKYANGAGYQNLTRLDAISGLTKWDNLTKLVKTRDVLKFPLNESNWEWIDKKQIWERRL